MLHIPCRCFLSRKGCLLWPQSKTPADGLQSTVGPTYNSRPANASEQRLSTPATGGLGNPGCPHIPNLLRLRKRLQTRPKGSSIWGSRAKLTCTRDAAMLGLVSKRRSAAGPPTRLRATIALPVLVQDNEPLSHDRSFQGLFWLLLGDTRADFLQEAFPHFP